MTIRKTLETLLIGNGLWPIEAGAVVAACEQSPEFEPMKNRMNDEASGYPKELLAVLWLMAKEEAIKWIDANKPNHFARAMFAEPTQGA